MEVYSNNDYKLKHEGQVHSVVHNWQFSMDIDTYHDRGATYFQITYTVRKTVDRAIGECRLQNSILCVLIKKRSVQYMHS